MQEKKTNEIENSESTSTVSNSEQDDTMTTNKQEQSISCYAKAPFIVVTVFIILWFVYLFSTNDHPTVSSSILISTDGIILNTRNLSNLFTKYLDPLCSINNTKGLNGTSYPSDCKHLLESMINLSQSQQFTFDEAQILVERIEYISKQKTFKYPVLFIHIPKTGGTGFGEWLQQNVKQTVHIWLPSTLDHNMFDRNHFPNAHRDRRRLNSLKDRNRILPRKVEPFRGQKIKFNFKNPKGVSYPKVLYGHLAYGFDALFLTPNEIRKLGHNPPGIVWKPRVNFTYITILRDPMTRVPSHYYYQKGRMEDPNHIWTDMRDLHDWIGWFEESKDCMVQFVSGCHHLAWYSKEYPEIWEKKLNPWPYRQRDVSPDMFDEWTVTLEQYKIARRHLMEMPWVGLTEHMTESVDQMKVLWDIDGTSKRTDNVNWNVNNAKPKMPILKRTRDRIARYNQFDSALYELGYVLFLQQKVVVEYLSHSHDNYIP